MTENNPVPDIDPSTVTLHDPTGAFFTLLRRMGCSLALSTDDYRLLFIGAAEGKPSLRAIVLPYLRGVAVQGSYLAAGTGSTVMVFKDTPRLAPAAPDALGMHDAMFMPRAIHFTGHCDFHDMGFIQGAIVAVNTRYSCICTIDGKYSFSPLWKPDFITELLPEDRCHLNGMAVHQEQIRFVTLLAKSNTMQGWRAGYLDNGGLLLEVPTGRVVAEGLALPHSPRIIGGRLYCLNSGAGELLSIDPDTGRREVLARLPGFAHGMVEHKGVLFIAVSKLRSRRTERKLPLEADASELICGVIALEAGTHRILGSMEIRGGTLEIYDLQILPGMRNPDIRSVEKWKDHHAIELPGIAFWASEPVVR